MKLQRKYNFSYIWVSGANAEKIFGSLSTGYFGIFAVKVDVGQLQDFGMREGTIARYSVKNSSENRAIWISFDI